MEEKKDKVPLYSFLPPLIPVFSFAINLFTSFAPHPPTACSGKMIWIS